MSLSTKSSELRLRITYWTALVSLLILLPSFSAAADICPDGYTSASFSATDYTNFGTITSGTPKTQKIFSNTTNLSASMTNNGNSQNIEGISGIIGTGGFQINQIMPNSSNTNIFTFTFEKAITNFKVNLYDIDRVQLGGGGFARFGDKVKITADNGSNPNFLTYQGKYSSINSAGNTITTGTGGFFNTSTDDCDGRNVSTSSDCLGVATFNIPIKSIKIEFSDDRSFGNQQNIIAQFQGINDSNICVQKDNALKITKTNAVSEINAEATTTYKITVNNIGAKTLSGITLKDPVATGLIKNNIGLVCDSTISGNVCTTSPKASQLEAGFTIPDLAPGKSYVLNVPAFVSATSENVTNTATAFKPGVVNETAEDTDLVIPIFTSPGYDMTTPANCPSSHKMYSISNTSSQTPNIAGWPTAQKKQSFIFTDNITGANKIFNIEFYSVIELDNYENKTPPFYGSLTGGTTNALNLYHTSPQSPTSKNNHNLRISVNRSISKIGYKIQDLDSYTSNNRTPYVEQVDVSDQAGQLTYNAAAHEINPARNIVTAKKGVNCGTGLGTIGTTCTIDTTWGYNSPNTFLSLKHNNTMSESSAAHAVGYSDFYFCLAPPKLVVKKELSANRINNDDQFEISVKDSSTTVNSFTTKGSNHIINTGSSGAFSIQEKATYTITEKVINDLGNGDIANYNANYTCTNTATNSKIVTTPMTYNSANKTRSFTLANATYGDEITCTITNSPASYTFSGTVFNDNGGIAASEANRQNISTLFTNNKQYFNGKLDIGELGIYENGLQVSLTDCNGNILDNKSVDVLGSGSDIGKYSITVSGNKLVDSTGNNLTELCLVEKEPSGWKYSVDTTADTREVTLVPEVYNYENLDFGEVEPDNTALVLIKSQHIHDCDESFNYPTNVGNAADLETGFGTQAADNVIPGRCIAYRVTAYNRGHIELEGIQIKDTLQIAPVASTFHLPFPVGNPAFINRYYNSLPNDIITSEAFNLLGVQFPTDLPQATLYFNTKYGSTLSH